MKFLDKLEEQIKAPKGEAHDGSITAARRRSAAERRARLDAKVEEERKLLDPADQMLARGTVVPKDFDGRCALAQSLAEPTPDGRQRSNREIAAMMGVTGQMIENYRHPDRYRARLAASRTGKPTAIDKAKVRKAEREKRMEEQQIEVPDFSRENFGARLTRHRRANNWSKSELARRMGATKEQVDEWEASRLRPSAGIYTKLMEVLDQ